MFTCKPMCLKDPCRSMSFTILSLNMTLLLHLHDTFGHNPLSITEDTTSLKTTIFIHLFNLF